MEKEKQPPAGPAASAPAPVVAPKADRAQEYAKQLAERQAKYNQRVQAAWAAYYKKSGEAYKAYQDSVIEIHEGGKKKAAASSESSPAQGLQAFKAARADSVRSATALHQQLRTAEHKYNTVCTSFWDEIWDEVSAAVDEFWNWVIGWWEDPPVEGGAAPFRTLADPAWRAALDPGAGGAYYAGWNYGASLY